MFFEEHEKKIYTSPGGKLYDPIKVDCLLEIATKGRLTELVAWRNAPYDNLGDVSEGAKERNRANSAMAELELAEAARTAFDLPSFPDCTDGEALENLYDFLGWMEGKGERVEKPLASPTASQGHLYPFNPTQLTSLSTSIENGAESEPSSTLLTPSESQQV